MQCVCVCVFFPSILDIKFVGRTSRGHTEGRPHRIFNPPSFCGACLDFCREKDSAIPFPRRPWSRILCTNELIVLHPLGIFFLFFFVFSEKNPVCRDRTHVPTCQKVTRCRLSYRGRPATWLCLYSLCNSILLLPCLMMYCIVSVLFLMLLWCTCMAINVSVQYNGGLLPDIVLLLNQSYYHRGTRLNAMKRFCIYLQPMIPPNKRLDISPPWLGDAQKVKARSDFSLKTNITPTGGKTIIRHPSAWRIQVRPTCG